MSKTKVIISVDLEFDINNTFDDPKAVPAGLESVRVEHDGTHYGLDMILDVLGRYELKGVFFVETAQAYYFGRGPMGALAREVYKCGHELQMHIHPVWRVFERENWRDIVNQRRMTAVVDDNFGALAEDEQQCLLRDGLDCFDAWGMPKPTAFRPGNMMIQRGSYPSLRAAGLEMSSSVALATREPDDDYLKAPGGVFEIEGITEIPVTTFREVAIGSFDRTKLLTLAGNSRTALMEILKLAQREGYCCLMMLTHASEFMPAGDSAGSAQPRVNLRKLDDFCSYLARHTEQFDVTTLDGLEIRGEKAARVARENMLSLPKPIGIRSLADRWLETRFNV